MLQDKKSAVVTIVDGNHLLYFDRFYQSIVKNGEWLGDFVILAYSFDENDVVLKKYQTQGVIVHHCPPLTDKVYRHWTPEVLTYFYLFSDFFKQWKKVVYLDIDCVVRSSLSGLIKKDGFYASNFYHRGHPDFIVSGLRLEAKNLINDGVMVFSTNIIKKETFSELLKIYHSLNLKNLPSMYGGGIDELVLAIYFKSKKKNLPLEYNVIPNELKRQYGIKSSLIYGAIIHHASGDFYPKPWDQVSPFHREWLKSGNGSSIFSEKIRLLFVLIWHLKLSQLLGAVGLALKSRFPFLYNFLKQKIK